MENNNSFICNATVITDENINKLSEKVEGSWVTNGNLYFKTKDIKHRYMAGDYFIKSGSKYFFYDKKEFEETHKIVPTKAISAETESGLFIKGKVLKRFKKELDSNILITLITYVIGCADGQKLVSCWGESEILELNAFVSLEVVPHVFNNKIEYMLKTQNRYGEEF